MSILLLAAQKPPLHLLELCLFHLMLSKILIMLDKHHPPPALCCNPANFPPDLKVVVHNRSVAGVCSGFQSKKLHSITSVPNGEHLQCEPYIFDQERKLFFCSYVMFGGQTDDVDCQYDIKTSVTTTAGIQVLMVVTTDCVQDDAEITVTTDNPLRYKHTFYYFMYHSFFCLIFSYLYHELCIGKGLSCVMASFGCSPAFPL